MEAVKAGGAGSCARRGRTHCVRAAIGLLAALATCTVSAQGAFPSRPIRWIVPVPPAGSSDNLARTMQPGLIEALGQQIVIDNRPGGSSVIGTELLVKAPPDGHTWMMVTTTHTVNPSMIASLPYDTVKDLASVSLVVSQSNILVVNPNVPVKSVKELIALARAKPDTLNFASGGNGSSPHLSGELLKLVTGVRIAHIPYKGTGPALVDLLANQVQMMFAGPLALEQLIKSGRLRALAVAAPRRNSVVPDVPTMAEAGVQGLETGTWYAVLAPAKTPKPVINTIYKAFSTVLKDPAIMQRMSAQGVDVIGSTPDELTAHIQSEIAKWSKVIKAANVKAG
jgi:tripartite-type tricarboxylate transporter receptor subunit TctC